MVKLQPEKLNEWSDWRPDVQSILNELTIIIRYCQPGVHRSRQPGKLENDFMHPYRTKLSTK
jgi:hypothetical protein